jgi:cytochrome P450
MTEVDFDHHSPEYVTGWRGINARLRAECPVAHTRAHGGFWVVSRYEDVAAVAQDDATFSSHQELPDGTRYGASIPTAPMRQVPVEMDPPEYFEYSKPLTPWFSPKAAKRREPYLRDVTTYCIDRVIESGRADLIGDIASPVPAILTLSLLGLPVDDWRTFSDAVHASLSRTPGTPERDAATAGLKTMMGTVAETIRRRRAEPADDLISHLVRAEVATSG